MLNSSPVGWFWAMAIIGWVMLPASEKSKRPVNRYLVLSAVVLLVILISSCGSSSSSHQNPNGTPAGTYTLTLTAKRV
jgi:hypothetical protein